MGRFGNVYTPRETAEAEDLVRTAFSLSWRRPPLTCPVTVVLAFSMPMPKSQRHVRAGQPHTKRPDLDNLEKLVLDALNGVAYADDSQVWSKSSRKEYGETPGIEITIKNYAD
jgi:Holliday junction resolvase RusA-like endonuclease